MLRGGGAGVGVLHDDALRGVQRLGDRGPVRHGGRRVRADHPQCPDPGDLGFLERAEEIHGPGAAPFVQRPGGQVPDFFDLGTLVGVQHGALAGQARAHVTHLASTHRIRLAGERERPRTGAADRAGRQVQVAQCGGVPGAVDRLVQPHRPQADELLRPTDPLRGSPQVRRVHPGDLRDGLDRVVGQMVGHDLPPLGEFGDEVPVGVSVVDDQPQQPVEQRHVRARPHRQMQVRLLRRRRAPRVDDNELRPLLHPVHHPEEEDRVAVGHVRPGDEEDIGMVEIVIGPGRAVRTERLLVTRRGGRHAQSRIRLDEVRAEMTLGQLVRQVLRLGRHLPGDVQRHGVVAVFLAQRGEAGGDLGHRGVHRGLLAVDEGRGLASSRGEQVGGRRALGAQAATVGRVGGGAFRGEDATVVTCEGEPAADAAVPADGVHSRCHGEGR